jgi:hypothetical protein
MFKISGIGLAVAVLFAAFATTATAQAPQAAAAPTAITPEAKAAGMKAAPALIQTAGVACTLTDARQVGTGKAADGKPATIYEVACSEGLGYIIASETGTTKSIVYDCLMMAKPGADGKPNSLVCRLPENANPALGMQQFVNGAGRGSCTVSGARFMGLTADQAKKIDEIACANGEGLVLTMAMSGPPAAEADNCLAYSGSNVACTLTTATQELTVAAALAQASGKCATMTKDRYVLSTTDGSDYFEVSCSDGKGYMLQANKSGKLADTIPCAQAYQIGNGCQLTDARQAESQQNTLYTDLAKKAGFNCSVSKYALFPQSDSTKDIVEMVCSNRPDGGVGVFPAKGGGAVYDCLRSQDEGYKCSFTQEDAVYPKLTSDLRAKGQSACVVSGARPFGRGDAGTDFVEVSCADGGPGLVLVFPAGSQAPSSLMNCAQAANVNGGCQLPRAKKS